MQQIMNSPPLRAFLFSPLDSRKDFFSGKLHKFELRGNPPHHHRSGRQGKPSVAELPIGRKNIETAAS